MLILYTVVCLLCQLPVWGRPQTEPPPTPLGQVDHQNQPQLLHSAGGTSPASPIPIVSQFESVGADGSFNFSYETGNGIHVQEGGFIKKVQIEGQHSAALNANGSSSESDNNGNIQVIAGAFSYTAPDGTVINLKYIADENGFQAEGDHLPTAPPIPPAIQRVLLGTLTNQTDQQRSARDYEPPIQANVDQQPTDVEAVEPEENPENYP